MVQIACKCGAVYEVTTHRAPLGDTGVAICEVCKREMDRWANVTVYETYVLVARPNEAPED